MDLDTIRKNILREIIELFQDLDNYSMLMEAINNKENIADLLKANAVVYNLLMASNRLVWNGNDASFEYAEELAKYQKGYYLYEQYACYFLGANIIHPSLNWQVSDILIENSLVTNDGFIDYQKFLDEDFLIRIRKSA